MATLYAGGELSMSRVRLGLTVFVILLGFDASALAQPTLSGSPGTASHPGPVSAPVKKQATNKSAQKKPAAQASNGTSQAGPTKLADVVITATRITQPVGQVGTTVTVINSQQIQDQKIYQTSDALREVPGVVVTQSGGPGTLTDVSIRGSSTSQVLTLLDGVEVNNGGSGGYDFANLMTNNASRIEVIRGAGGSLYGSSAIGGVINQISEEGTGAPKFSLLSDGGNWDTERQVAN